ncbi:MAG: acetate/propionate family kinase [Candidatus Aminicenantes bacterium]
MDSTEIMQFLREQVELFRDFPQNLLEKLVAEVRVTTFEPNEAIIEFGSEGRYLGVMIEGEAEASVTDDGGDKHILDVLKPGDIFGEISLMTGDRSMADVIGLTRCKVLLWLQRFISSILTTYPPAVAYLSKTIVNRLKSSTYSGKDQEIAISALKRSDDPYGFKLKTDKPLKILVVNCGSSSLKYNLFDTEDEKKNARGKIERIGEAGTRHTYRSEDKELIKDLPRGGHEEAFNAMVEALTAINTGVIASTTEISAVGHRVVHGGDKYNNARIIDDEVLAEIEKAAELAPLHNPVNLLGINMARKLFPQAPQVAVFDTAFHQTLPAYAYLYGLPYEYFEKKQIKRYGFHGTSHAYVSLKVAEFLKRPYNELETIVCHLGNGASICAVDHGRSIDTSMGLTPTEGLIMGTRCGDIDPAVILHLIRTEGMDIDDLHRLINKDGGLKGLSGLTNDMREIEAAANKGHHRALLAFKTFCYRVRKYIGAYYAAMGGLDAIAFTGGIGQGSAGVRSLACQGLTHMGIRIDEKKNREAKGFLKPVDISEDNSPVRVLVIPTQEELMIARETIRTLRRSYVTEIIHSQEPLLIPIEVSAHHVHLSDHHVEALFGKGHQLTPLQELSQPGQYACKERVNLIGPKGRVNNVRVLGPTRKETQVEIAMTEQFKLGIHPPIRESGDLANTPGVTLESETATIKIDKGVICAMRHIHMQPEDALRMGLKDRDVVMVRIPGKRELIFGDVLVRVRSNYKLAMHLDTDEANAADISDGIFGQIERIQSRN